MSKVMKAAIVSEMVKRFEGHDSAVVVNAGQLTVEQTQELRTRLRNEGVSMFFLRNRLAAIALEKTGFTGLESVLQGPAALCLGGEGAIVISKIVMDFAKENDRLEVLGGYIDGEVLDSGGVVALSKMPGRQELLAMVLQGMFGPVSDLARSMDGLFQEIHGLIEALENKGGASS